MTAIVQPFADDPGRHSRRSRRRAQRHGQLDHQDAAGPLLLGVPGHQEHGVAAVGHGHLRLGLLRRLPDVGRACRCSTPGSSRPSSAARPPSATTGPSPTGCSPPPGRVPVVGPGRHGGARQPADFFRQQLRWKKSWLRESLYVVRLFWRKNPLAALFTYASIVFPFMAPVRRPPRRARAGDRRQLLGPVVLPDRHLRHGAALLPLSTPSSATTACGTTA